MSKTFNEEDFVFIHKETGIKINLADIRFRRENNEFKLGISRHMEVGLEPKVWIYDINEIMFSDDFIKYLIRDKSCVVERCFACGKYDLLDVGHSKLCECGYMIPF